MYLFQLRIDDGVILHYALYKYFPFMSLQQERMDLTWRLNTCHEAH